MKKNHQTKTILMLGIICQALVARNAECQQCYSEQEQTCPGAGGGGPTQILCGYAGDTPLYATTMIVSITGSYYQIILKAGVGQQSALASQPAHILLIS
jgi:hypothetical protein